MKKLLLLLLLVPLISFGQTKEGLQLCLAMQSNNFMSETEAENALDRILNTIGVSKNFILVPCGEISNAAATSYKGIRYILYDKEFMQLISSRTNNWSSLAILAHEVGHHINGHTLDITMYAGGVVEPKSLEIKRKQELEADEFAGFVLARLGASLNNALSFTSIFSDKDDTYSTHPSKSKRINAIRKGYNKAGGNSSVANTNNTPTEYTRKNTNMSVEEYISIADKNYKLRNYKTALVNLNNAISIEDEIGWTYNYRGMVKQQLKQYESAAKDYLKAIDLVPESPAAYYNLGLLFFKLTYYEEALKAYDKAIEINPYDYIYYLNRGDTNYRLQKYKNAIIDYSSSLKINPNESYIYLNRGLAKLGLKDYEGANQDYTIAIKNHSLGEIDWNLDDGYFNRAITYAGLSNYNGAINDYSEVIRLNPNEASAYFYRGINKYKLEYLESACNDFEKAISLGYKKNIEWVRDQCN